jgi:hypothetical protein
MFIAGFAAAIFTVAAMRLDDGPFSLVQLPVLGLVLAVFFLKDSRLAAFALGVGLGLDAVSSYSFFAWTAIICGTAFVGWWLSKTVLTNRSLPSLMILGGAMRIAYFIFEAGFSRLSGLFGGTVWYLPTGINIGRVLTAFAIEMLILLGFFVIHMRVRGERARMLTHL